MLEILYKILTVIVTVIVLTIVCAIFLVMDFGFGITLVSYVIKGIVIIGVIGIAITFIKSIFF